eukprot:1973543-Rhodomonas_salina.1
MLSTDLAMPYPVLTQRMVLPALEVLEYDPTLRFPPPIITEKGYVLRSQYAMSGTDIGRAAPRLTATLEFLGKPRYLPLCDRQCP